MTAMRRSCVALAWLASLGTAWAHHGVANFDLNKEITISGTVTRIDLVNPHSWLFLDAPGADGRVVTWRCELRGATVLRRSGWSPEMFRAGTTITITGAPDRFEPNTCYLGSAVFADGTRVDRYGQISRATAAVVDRPLRHTSGAPNFAGDWAAEQRVLTDPRGMAGAFLPMSVARDQKPGSVPEGTQAFPGTRGTAVSLADDPIGAYWNRPSALPLTDAGRKAIQGFDGASTDNPRLRCEPTNILFYQNIITRKVGQLRALGVEFVFGSDEGSFGMTAAQATWRELDAWVRHLDVDPMMAIRKATLDAARHLGVDRETGTVSEGKFADVIGVAGNPLQHIDVLRTPAVVVKHGRRYK
jgi:hypothetical protein